MKLYLVRHGETHWNTLNKLQSFTDNKLNEEGHNQGLKTGKYFSNINVNKIFSSPLIRAQETAEYISKLHKIDLIIDERITERNYGDLEGGDYLELREKMKPIILENRFHELNIEDPYLFKKRIKEFWEEIHEKYFGENVVIVSHSGTIKMLIAVIQNESYEVIRKKVHKKNASITKIEFSSPNIISVIDIGYDKHLD